MSQRYRAFLTYSHADEKMARWLHQRLERFVIPKHLRTDENPGRTIAPIFRDLDELNASGELNDALKNAIECSDALIVICSPAGARSQWVNAEIRWFRQTHPGAPIACVIVAGEPGDPEHECFPTALDDPSGLRARDRVSADLRAGHDSQHDALLRVAAGVLGVGFDALKQRHQRRRIRTLTAINAMGAVIIIALAALTWVAYQASRDAARRQGQAEELVGFMLGDLRGRLEPIGRLDVLDAVGDEASAYFESLEDADETDNVLLSRAKAMRQIGDIRVRQGRLAEAAVAFTQALEQSALLSSRAPLDADRRFELAQAEFWVGYAHQRNGDQSTALGHMERYLQHAQALVRQDSARSDYALEVGYANNNLGVLNIDLDNLAAADSYFAAAESTMRTLHTAQPENTLLTTELAQVVAWQGKTALALGRLVDAISHHREQESLLRELAAEVPDDKPKQRYLAVALLLHGEALALEGKAPAALEKFVEADRIMAELTAYDTTNRDWQRNAARASWYLGRLIEQSGDLDRAIEQYEAAYEIFADLIARDDQQARWQNDFAETASTLLRAYRDNGEQHRAQVLARAVELLDVQSTPRLTCELTLAHDPRENCREATALVEEAARLRTDTNSYLSLYSILHTQNDVRQEDAWQTLSTRRISGRDFVDTL